MSTATEVEVVGRAPSSTGQPLVDDGHDPVVEARIARFRKALFIALGILVVSEVLSAVGIVSAPHDVPWAFIRGGNPLLASAMLGAFVNFVFSRPKAGPALSAVGMGLALEAALAGLRIEYGQSTATIITNAGAGLGLAALIVSAVLARPGRSARGGRPAVVAFAERRRWMATLMAGALIPTFLVLSGLFTEMTVLLHPKTYDTLVYLGDAALGFHPSFVLARWLRAAGPLQWLVSSVYVQLPVAFVVIFSAEGRARIQGRDVLTAFLLAGMIGLLCYHAFPVIGPRFMFGRVWPAAPPDMELVPGVPVLAPPALRNCIPSLHTTWVLLLVWYSRPLKLRFRVFAAVWASVTLFATLSLGYHYFLDLVIAVPFAVAVQALATRGVSWRTPERAVAFGVGAVLTAGWLLLVRVGTRVLINVPELAWGLTIFTVVLPLAIERRLWNASASSSAPGETSRTQLTRPSTGDPVVTWGVAAAFFLSGFVGLVYEVLFAKSLAMTFGSTATASVTVLATYMGGMALGSWLGGILSVRRAEPLKVYAYCEAGVALTCAASPVLLPLILRIYVALATGRQPGSPSLTCLQVLLGAALLLPPTVLMGVTLPVLTRFFVRGGGRIGTSVAALYGVNTLGAAFGAVITGYLILPFFGVLHTTLLAVGANLVVAVLGLRLAARAAPSDGTRANPSEDAHHEPPASESVTADALPARDVAIPDARLRAVGLIILGVGGVVTLALETTYVHLLAVVAGCSTYAFSLMLFAFLLGLGGGSTLGREALRRAWDRGVVLACAQALLAATVLVGVFWWQAIPEYFASFERYPAARTFASRECVRFVVCCLALIPPAACIGASYPAAIDAATSGLRDRGTLAMGRAAAINTLGNIVGAIVGGFWLIRYAGSLRALQVLAVTSCALALLALVALSRWRSPVASLSFAVPVCLFAIQPASFDWTRIAAGGNVYFARQFYGKVVAHAESMDGGLTTVNEMVQEALPDSERKTNRVLTLLTNGKFQGDDGSSREMRAQVSFPLMSLFHTARRDRALVIGVGTGVSVRTTRDAGFARVDVVDLSRDVVALARTHFRSVNAGALDETPNGAVRVYITDGRNFLLTHPREDDARYDFVGIELSSIWFAGAASLYNREFYELAASHLRGDGVLEQWVQLHRLDMGDIASIIATMHDVFPHIWLYFAGNQGVLVGCQRPCPVTREALKRVDEQPALAQALHLLGGSAEDVHHRTLLLTPSDVDGFLEQLLEQGGDTAALVSTDDNLFLEYHTPRANVRPYFQSLQSNVAYLERFSSLRRPEPEGRGAPAELSKTR